MSNIKLQISNKIFENCLAAVLFWKIAASNADTDKNYPDFEYDTILKCSVRNGFSSQAG